MRLYLLRHGATEWNMLKLLQGQTDVPLNDEGINSALQCGEEMKDIPFHKIYTSTLVRAYKTAELIRGFRDIPIVRDKRIKEACFGVLEGVDLTHIPEPHLQLTYNTFFNDPANYVPVDGGESFSELIDRATSFLDDVVSHEPDDSHILIVAHGAIIKALQMKPFNRTLDDFWAGGVPANCSACILDYTDGVYTLVSQGEIVTYAKPR